MIHKVVIPGFKIFFLAAAILLFLCASVVLYAAVQFSRGPVNVTWAQNYIQDALTRGQDGVSVKAEGIVAEWQSFRSPFSLGIANLKITDRGQEILNVSQAGMQLAKGPLLFGIVSPDSIYIKGPSIKLVRAEGGKFSFFVSDKKPLDAAEPSKTFSIAELEDKIFLPTLAEGITATPAAHLESLVIEDAKVAIEDRRFSDNWILPQADFSLQRHGDTVIASLKYKSQLISEGSKMTATLVRHANDIDYSAIFENVESDLWVRNFLSFPSLMNETYTIDGQIAGALDKKWMPVTIHGELVTSNPVFESQSFIVIGKRDAQGLMPLRISLAEIALDQIAIVWPPELEDLNITHWLTERLSDGIIHDLVVTVPLKVEGESISLSEDIVADLDFENLTADYRAPLMPAREAAGHLRFANDALDIDVHHAKLGDAIAKDSKVIVTNLTGEGIGVVDIDINLAGPVRTVVDYVSEEPINLGDNLGVDPALVAGMADMKIEVDFPASKHLDAKEAAVKVDAKLTDLRLPKILHGMDLTGGPYDLLADRGAFSLKGKGQLDGRAIDLDYSEYINLLGAPYISDIKARVTSDEDMRRKFGADLSNFVSGPLSLDIAYLEKTKGNGVIDVKADLTQAQVFVKPLDYLKPAGKPGSANAKIHLKNGDIDAIKNLDVRMGEDEATGGDLALGKIGAEIDVTEGSFGHVRLGPDNDFALQIEQSAGLLKLTANGKNLDARPFLKADDDDKADDKEKSQTVVVDAKADIIRTGDAPDQVLKNGAVKVAVNKMGQIENLTAQGGVGQKGEVSVTMGPDADGATVLKAISNDAGAAFRVAGVYENLIGGTLDISGRQIEGGGIDDIGGQAIIRDFRVVRAPVLAQMISVFSLTGLPNLLMNDGIGFSRMRTKFIWKDTDRGRIINLYDGSTSGGAIGLTFGGVVNQEKKTMDVSGTFVPISGINKFVSSIPLVGKLLTGGSNGGIIAATYSVRGPSEDPRVRVNPLSVLAPGILRSILFEGGMDKGADEEPARQ